MASILLPWLGCIFEQQAYESETIRKQVAAALAPLLAQNPTLLDQVVALLASPGWPARQGAAWALIHMPGGPPLHLLPRLKALLHDFRAEESWPQRLQVAEILLNHREPELDRRAIAVAVAALDYATKPWYSLPQTGTAVRRQAALILGQLDPVYYDAALFDRLRRVMEEDTEEQVRDAAYQALLRMAVAPKQGT